MKLWGIQDSPIPCRAREQGPTGLFSCQGRGRHQPASLLGDNMMAGSQLAEN